MDRKQIEKVLNKLNYGRKNNRKHIEKCKWIVRVNGEQTAGFDIEDSIKQCNSFKLLLFIQVIN